MAVIGMGERRAKRQMQRALQWEGDQIKAEMETEQRHTEAMVSLLINTFLCSDSGLK